MKFEELQTLSGEKRDSILMMLSLERNRMLNGGHVYAGTADPAVVARRRAKNKVARRTRAAARKRG